MILEVVRTVVWWKEMEILMQKEIMDRARRRKDWERLVEQHSGMNRIYIHKLGG
ncbi:hypothetical protein M8C21_026806 [Ambrosia artemisiifolia]|uniref:Uncharacterized protein n=1 Tax=Ambrosia artemisiifolia TaxID=4212 RepID=A0AAD5BRV5_AMBAR|nr:hypothetical protein M8C21_026806 [Ambrosia artemisiifolia]